MFNFFIADFPELCFINLKFLLICDRCLTFGCWLLKRHVAGVVKETAVLFIKGVILILQGGNLRNAFHNIVSAAATGSVLEKRCALKKSKISNVCVGVSF